MRPRVRHLAALALIGAAIVPSAATPASGPGAPAYVRVLECSRGDSAFERSATFRAAMGRVPGTAAMGIRFALQDRSGGGRWRGLKARGLGVWRKSRPGVRRFAHRQRVLALPSGGSYRAVVSYRWYGSDGAIVRSAKRRSRGCRQPGALANLRPVRVGGRPVEGAPGTVRYSVQVRNRGAVAAERFGVMLRVDGDAVDTLVVDRLSPGELRTVEFTGPACVAAIEARVDPDDSIREANERDNTLTASCPV